MEPIFLVSEIWSDARNRRQRLNPHRRWLHSNSAISMV